MDDLATKRLVTGLHIGEIEIGEHIRHEREQFVAHRMPEKEHPVRLTTSETTAVHHVGISRDERTDDLGKFTWVVLEVGILHDDVRQRCRRKTGAQCRTLTLIVRL